jgi:transcriptional regulator with XRE-family HTH domain
MKIGERIRARRKELGLNLRELGEQVNVSASFLSQVENNQVSPSLNSLQSIATALQVPMFYFLNDVSGGEIVRVDKRRRLYFAHSKMGYDLLTPNFSRQMMAVLIHMEPYACRVAMPLARPTEQWMHVTQGRMEIKIGEETSILETGDTIYYDGDLLREFRSICDEELIIICCITPPML